MGDAFFKKSVLLGYFKSVLEQQALIFIFIILFV